LRQLSFICSTVRSPSCAVKSAADADRILAKGFNGRDRVTVKLPDGKPAFVDQAGILASTDLDPSTGFATAIDASP
jgi:hypothetical protein